MVRVPLASTNSAGPHVAIHVVPATLPALPPSGCYIFFFARLAEKMHMLLYAFFQVSSASIDFLGVQARKLHLYPFIAG
jgi:hypothetical protein